MKNNDLHPGQILKQLYIDPNHLSVKDLSKQLDMKYARLSKVIKGQQSITSELSLKLADKSISVYIF